MNERERENVRRKLKRAEYRRGEMIKQNKCPRCEMILEEGHNCDHRIEFWRDGLPETRE